jgi:acyl-CoA dehydrogenase
MDNVHEETIKAVRQATEGVTAKYGRDYYLRKGRDNEDIPEMWAAMAAQGLLGLDVPEEYGGSGRNVIAAIAFTEAMAEAGVPAVFALATSFSRNAISVGGTTEQCQRFVTPTVTGAKRICFALTEPEAGTNSFNISTRARLAGDVYVLNGQKTFISHIDHADFAVVVAKTEGPDQRDEIGLFVVELPAEGLTMHRRNINLFTPDNRFHVFLDDVRVPVANRIGGPGQGKRILFTALNPERFLVAAMTLGLGQLALIKGVEYAKVRAPFGTPIGAYQGVAHPLARAKAHLDAARLMIYEGAAKYEAGQDPGAMASISKFLAAEAASEALDAAIQAHGGSAFDEETDVSTLWPMIRLQRIAPVNDEMILNHISQHVLGLPRSY